MKLLSIFLLFAIFSSGIARQPVNDLPSAYLDHGEVIVEDKPDLPGNITGPDGSPPTHVTYNDIEEATTKRIYH